MAQVLFANNAEAILAGGIGPAALSLSVGAGQGSKFPSIAGGSGDWFPVTLRSASFLEIVRCTARTGDVLTVLRAQEGTLAQTFAAGDLVQERLTVAALNEIVGRIAAAEAAAALANQPGDTKYRPGNAVLTGWVRANGLTIGNAASTGTERASADTEPLFTFLWSTFADAQCPVLPGARGASAAADFAANKRLTLPDAAGRAFICLDNAGAGAKARLTTTASPDGSTPGATGGSETRVLVTANLPVHNHVLSSPTGSGTATASGDHNHGANTGAGTAHTHGASTGATGDHTHAVSGTTDAQGTHSHSVTDIFANSQEVSDAKFQGGGPNTVIQPGSSSGGTGQGFFAANAGNHAHNVTGGTGGASIGNHAHSVTVNNEAAHTHPIAASGTHTHAVTLAGTSDNTGSDTPFNNMGPFIALGTLYIKL
jgi:hypothetical protein